MIEQIVQELRTNYKDGLNKDIDRRISQLRALYNLLDKEEVRLLEALERDLKRPISEGYLVELQPIKNSISHMISNLHEYLEPKSVEKPLVFSFDRCETRLVPLGVVLIISPWNYPIQLALNPLVGAIAGGNTVVLKPSEIAPNTSALLAELIPKYLDSRIVKVVLGGIPESTRLLEQKFDLIFYTGSTQVGRIVYQAAAKQITPVILELGGKSPVIVDSAADVKIAAKRIVWAKLLNAGQTCIAPDYVLVDKKIKLEFIESAKNSIKELLEGDPYTSTHFSRIISKNHFSRLTTMIEEQKKADGSNMVLGGMINSQNLFIEPTLFDLESTNAHQDPVMKEELFGPILPIIGVENVEDAISFVKKVKTGDPLSLYVFTTKSSVYEKIFSKINCGHAVVNDVVLNAGIEGLPFGGVNESGIGSYHGPHSIKSFTREQGFFIRKSASFNFTELLFCLRYQNISGDSNWKGYKMGRYLLEVRPPYEAGLLLARVLRYTLGNLIIQLLIFAVAGFLIGHTFPVQYVEAFCYVGSAKADACGNTGERGIYPIKMSTKEAAAVSQIPKIVSDLRSHFESQITKNIDFRISQLRALYKLLSVEEKQLLAALKKDLHRPETEGYLIELQPIKNSIAHMISNLHEYLEPKSVEKPIIFAMDRCETRLVPLGVVLIISPWNYPIQLALNPLVGAIAGGNTVVLKPSEIAPNTSALLAELIPKYLDSRIVKVVLGGIPESTRLLEQKFDLIFYTGSTQVGRIVYQAAAKQITPVILELGGKSPVIVDSSVNVKIAAKRIVWGKLLNAGQTCIAPDYILVDKFIKPKFIEAVKNAIKELLEGDASASPHFSRIISKNHFSRLSALMELQKKADGCKMVFGGSTNPQDLFIEPTVFSLESANAHQDPVMKEEIFGPLLPIIGVENVDDAISFVKKVKTGDPLSLYVFTNKSSVHEKIFSQINCGHAVVNETIMNGGVEELPFGGVNESGLGSYHGPHSIKCFTREQGFFIRSIQNDLVNYIKYQPMSGKVNSIWYKMIRFLADAHLPGPFGLKLHLIWKYLSRSKLSLFLVAFMLGYRWKK